MHNLFYTLHCIALGWRPHKGVQRVLESQVESLWTSGAGRLQRGTWKHITVRYMGYSDDSQ